MNAVFIDTVALLALCSRRDALHPSARAVLKNLATARTPFVTSQWVLTEFLGRAAAGALREAAIADTHRILGSPSTEVVPASAQSWQDAFEFYEEREDKHWSLVDCTSILICRQRAIRQVFTHDRHFTQAGFEILLP